jgi:hypothetical protein
LKSLFRDERRRIVSRIVDSTLADVDKLYGDVYEHNTALINFLRDLHMPLPPILRVSSEFVLNNAIHRSLSGDEIDLERVRFLMQKAQQSGVSLDPSLNVAMRERLDQAMERWSKEPLDLKRLTELEPLVSLLCTAPFEADLWNAQNTYYKVMTAISRLEPPNVDEKWLEHFRKIADWLGIAVPKSFLLTSAERDELTSPPSIPCSVHPATPSVEQSIQE